MRFLIFLPIIFITSCSHSIEHQIKGVAQFDLFCYPKDITVKHHEPTGLYQAECHYDGIRKFSVYTVEDDRIKLVTRGK